MDTSRYLPFATDSDASYQRPGLRPQTPYHMVWLATNACNARCVHCSTNAAKRLPGELTTAEAISMFDQLAQMGVLDVAVSGGEPLVREDIFELLAYAIRLRIRVGVGSNGSPVTPTIVRQLKEVGVNRLQISIDGLEETHDRARRWPGLYQKSVRAIELGLAAGLHVHVCFTAHRMNHADLGKVIDCCAEWGVQRFNLSRFVPTGRGTSVLDLAPQEWRAVVGVYEAKRAEYGHRMQFTTHLAQLVLTEPELNCLDAFIGCQAGVGQGCIGPQGQVTPCVMLPIVVGRLRDMPLSEIWNTSPVIRALRERSNVKGQCQTCLHRAKCGGCRAVAYAYTGDYLAADPRCWNSPEAQERSLV